MEFPDSLDDFLFKTDENDNTKSIFAAQTLHKDDIQSDYETAKSHSGATKEQILSFLRRKGEAYTENQIPKRKPLPPFSLPWS